MTNLVKLDNIQRLVILDRRSILDQYFNNSTGNFRLDFIEEFHGFDDAYRLALGDLIANGNKGGRVGIGGTVKGSDHRRFYLDGGLTGRFGRGFGLFGWLREGGCGLAGDGRGVRGGRDYGL